MTNCPNCNAHLLTLADVSDRIGLAHATVKSMRSRGDLPAPDIDVKGQPLWLASTIDGWRSAPSTPRKRSERRQTAVQLAHDVSSPSDDDQVVIDLREAQMGPLASDFDHDAAVALVKRSIERLRGPLRARARAYVAERASASDLAPPGVSDPATEQRPRALLAELHTHVDRRLAAEIDDLLAD